MATILGPKWCQNRAYSQKPEKHGFWSFPHTSPRLKVPKFFLETPQKTRFSGKKFDLLFYFICLDPWKWKFQNGGRVTGWALCWEPFCVILAEWFIKKTTFQKKKKRNFFPQNRKKSLKANKIETFEMWHFV